MKGKVKVKHAEFLTVTPTLSDIKEVRSEEEGARVHGEVDGGA